MSGSVSGRIRFCRLPDGASYNKVAEWKPEEFSAARDRCDVRIGDNSFSGDLHSYKITARIEDIAADVNLIGEIPAWRPRTGHWYFGPQGEHEFNWLPAVPQGRVDATYSVGGEAHTASGVGYHDHNWGNALLNSLINHWYWARGQHHRGGEIRDIHRRRQRRDLHRHLHPAS